MIPPLQVADEGVSGAVPEFLFGNNPVRRMTFLCEVLADAHTGAEGLRRNLCLFKDAPLDEEPIISQ